MNGYPDNNPKTAIGVTKAPLHLVPPSASHHLALAFKDGAAKYGPYNWRDKTVSSSVYVGAAKRHIDAWWDGENLSPDAGIEHLAHAMACMAIILDAASIGMLNDDRPTKGAAARLQADFAAAKALDMVSMAPPVIPHALAAAAIRDGMVEPGGCAPPVYHATIAPMPPHEAVIAQTEEALREALGIDPEQDDDEGAPGEPPRCKTGGCD